MPEETFWFWNSFITYTKYIGLMTAVMFGLTLALKSNEAFIAVVGYLSSGIEALLGVPQFLLNYRRKNTEGLSVVLILIWLAGDLYKFTYYSSNNSPIALVICATFQICTDISILSQFWIYRNAKQSTSVQDKFKVKDLLPPIDSQSSQSSSEENTKETNNSSQAQKLSLNTSVYSVISTKSGQSSPFED